MTLLEGWLAERKAHVERLLAEALPSQDILPQRLHAAMRYAALGGGKRFRAALVYATGEALNANPQALDQLATAVELIHAYSLVHDDLPAMDDDALRRGQPTLHVAFDEATAILAGDALQALSFELLGTPCEASNAQQQLLACREVATAIGSYGMAGGQALDLEAEGQDVEVAGLEAIHLRKTGRLIQACVVSTAYLAGVDNAANVALAEYARLVGLAYQVHDDILDETADTETLGKTAGADVARQKSTYPACLGLERSMTLAQKLAAEACEALPETPGRRERLEQLAYWVVNRPS